MTFFITAQTAFHHCTFQVFTAHFVHHCKLKQALLFIQHTSILQIKLRKELRATHWQKLHLQVLECQVVLWPLSCWNIHTKGQSRGQPRLHNTSGRWVLFRFCYTRSRLLRYSEFFLEPEVDPRCNRF